MKVLAEQIGDIDGVQIYGRVVSVRGLMVEVAGPICAMSVGGRLNIETGPGGAIACEVVAFSGGHALAMRFAALVCDAGAARSCPRPAEASVRPAEGWLGRGVNALGEPIDGWGPLPPTLRRVPSAPHRRPACAAPTLHSISASAPQHLSSPAAAGSAWASFQARALSVLARNVAADVSVIGLVGERGREVLRAAITRARQAMATYADMEELIRLGAYRPGSSPEVDEAIALHAPLEDFLRQRRRHR